MPLNKMQIERIEAQINSAKHAYIEAKHNKKMPDMPGYSEEEMTELIRNGVAKLKHGCTANSYGTLKQAFIFPPSETMSARQSGYDEWYAARKVVTDEANTIAERLMDMAVLEKDGMVALNRIAEAFKT